MLLYGILVPSSYMVGLLVHSGAGIAERGWTDAGAKAELWEELTLFLVFSLSRPAFNLVSLLRAINVIELYLRTGWSRHQGRIVEMTSEFVAATSLP